MQRRRDHRAKVCVAFVIRKKRGDWSHTTSRRGIILYYDVLDVMPSLLLNPRLRISISSILQRAS